MSKLLSERKTEFGIKNTVPLETNGRTTLNPSKNIVDRSIKTMFEPNNAAGNEAAEGYTNAMFLNDLKKANAVMGKHSLDSQTGRAKSRPFSERDAQRIQSELEAPAEADPRVQALFSRKRVL